MEYLMKGSVFGNTLMSRIMILMMSRITVCYRHVCTPEERSIHDPANLGHNKNHSKSKKFT